MSEQSTGSPAIRIPFLDLLRALAIALVMIHHYRNLPGTPELFRWFGLRGYIGVDVFFVLSGWLIGGQLFRELDRSGRLRLGRFWVRRWLRTLPLYYGVLLITALFDERVRSHWLEMLFFVQNYTTPQTWLITWSLCIEEHFYLVLPLLVLAAAPLVRGRPGLGLLLGAAVVMLSPTLRALSFDRVAGMRYQAFLNAFYVPTHLRMEGLFLGVGLAALQRWQHPLWRGLARRPWAVLVSGALLFVAAVWAPWLSGWTASGTDRMAFFNVVPQFLLVSLGVALLVAAGVSLHERGRTLGLPGMTWAAEHAYALYLLHLPALHWVNKSLPWPGNFLATCGLAVAAAMVTRQLFELPGLRLRGWWMARARARQTTPG